MSAPYSSSVESADTATNVSSTEPAAGAVSTDNSSWTAIANAVAAALVATRIGGSKVDNGKEKRHHEKRCKGQKFLQAEMDCMLVLIKEHVPLSISQWQKVVDKHMMYFPDTHCNIDGLHHKFKDFQARGYQQETPSFHPM